jgi:hypothetical protein
MINSDCRCPGCGQCDASIKIERLRAELVEAKVDAALGKLLRSKLTRANRISCATGDYYAVPESEIAAIDATVLKGGG